MFAQLDTKTVYSFMDSLIDLEGYVKAAKSLGYQTVGIMDKDIFTQLFILLKRLKNNPCSLLLG